MSDGNMSDFNTNNNNPRLPSVSPDSETPQALDVMQRDRFELLSAYMDGEVTPEERKQVELWLAQDPTVQKLHERLLALRDGLQSMPIPASETSVQKTVDAVFAKVDRQPKLRLIWGGAAAAAVMVGAVTSLFVSNRGPILQVADSPQVPATTAPIAQPPEPTTAKPLLIALDKPLVSIPKAAVVPSDLPDTPLDSGNNNVR